MLAAYWGHFLNAVSWAQQVLLRIPVFFRYTPGMSVSSLGGTFSRASVATFIDANGLLQTAPSGVLRDSHYIGGVRTTLLEGARTNLCLQSHDLTATWTLGASTVGTGVNSPDGGTAANKIKEDNTTAQHYVLQSFTKAASALPYACSAYFQQAERTFAYLVLDDGTGNNGSIAWFNLATGAVGTVSHAGYTNALTSVSSRIDALTGTMAGWYRCTLMATSTAGTTLRIISGPATTDAVYSYAGVTGNGVNAWGFDLEQAAFPSSYIATTAASVTRATDALSFPFAAVPQAMTLYIKWNATVGNGSGANSPALVVGATGTVGNRYDIWQNNTTTGGGTRGAHTGTTTTALGNATNLYDSMESVLQVDASGNATAIQSLLGAAQTSTAATAGPANEAAFASQTLMINARNGPTADFQTIVQKVVIAAVGQTIQTMRSL